MALLDSIFTVARLVKADMEKLSRYWVIVVGYIALAILAVPGAILLYHAEQAIHITSGGGYEFAIGLMTRYLDVATPILYVMLCVLFAIDVANSTIKYLLTRPVTRLELLASKHITAGLMVFATIVILWGVALGAGAFYYGLGDLTENDYVLFPASYVMQQIVTATVFILIAYSAVASLAVAVSTWSSTMGGAIIMGLIFFYFFDAMAIVPATISSPFGVPLTSLAFPSQVFVPMYVLDDLPTGIAVQTWWSEDLRRMVAVCGSYTVIFVGISVLGVKTRDFTL